MYIFLNFHVYIPILLLVYFQYEKLVEVLIYAVNI